MAFFEAVATCFLKYAVFSGRGSRAEYWSFVLFLVLVLIVVNLLDYTVFGGQIKRTFDGFTVQTSGPLSALFLLSVLCPLLAAGCRRMHDSGRSGVHLFYPLIAMLGVSMFFAFMTGFIPQLSGDWRQIFSGLGGLVAFVALFILTASPLIVIWWLTRPSQPGDNRYGPPPFVRQG